MRSGSKRPFRAVGLLLAALLALTGCTRLVPEAADAPALSVCASFYPLFALTDMVASDAPGVELSCLVQPQDGCLRAYALSDWDLALIGYQADVMVVGGRGLEAFEGQLYALGEAGPAVITAFAGLPLHDDGTAGAGGEDASHWQGENPHLYLSTAGAAEAAAVIAENLARLDPGNAAVYARNLESAQGRLGALGAEMREIAAAAAGQPVFLLNEALFYTAAELDLPVAGWYERESGAALSGSEWMDCLAALRATPARVVLLEKQAPAALAAQLTEAGYGVARINILSAGRAEMGAEGYFAAQWANAAAVAEAFRALDE